MTGKLYAKHGGVFIESGLHTSDVAELTAKVKRLETELKQRSKQIGIACLKHDMTHSLCCGKCFADMQTDNVKLRNAIAALMPFLMEDYDGGIMTAEYRAAIELAIAANKKVAE